MKSLSSSHHYNYQSLSMLWSEWLERCWVERPCRHKSHVHKMRVYKWSILIAEENNLDFMAVWLKTNMAKWLVTKQIQACPKVSKIFKGAQTILFTAVKNKYIHLSFKRSFFFVKDVQNGNLLLVRGLFWFGCCWSLFLASDSHCTHKHSHRDPHWVHHSTFTAQRHRHFNDICSK